MTRPVSAKPVPSTPRRELPSDLQRFTKTPVATWMTSSPNGPKEPVAGDLASYRSVWLDAGAAGTAVGVRLEAKTLEEAIPAAQKVAQESRYVEKDQYQEYDTQPMYHVRVAPQAILHGADGHYYAAPMDDAPGWSSDGQRSGAMELETHRQWGDAEAKADRSLHSILGAAPELEAVVDNDRYWKTEHQSDALYPVKSEK